MSYFTNEEIDGYINFKWKIFKIVGPICLALIVVIGIFAIYANRTTVSVDSHSWLTQCSIMENGKEVDYCHSEGEGMQVIPPSYDLKDGQTMDIRVTYYIHSTLPSGKSEGYRTSEELFYQMEDGKTYSTDVDQSGCIVKIY